MAILRPTPVPTPSAGRTYPTNFIGPLRPQDRRAPTNFIGPTYSQPNNLPSGQVLGARTSSLGVQPPAPSSSQSSSYDLLEPIPTQPSFDQTPFNEIANQIDQLGNVFRGNYETAAKGIQTRSGSELSALEQNKTEAEQNLQQYKTQAEQDAEKNIDESRRQFAEIQQGLQARYGGTTGTGAFVSELAGRQTLGSIGNFRQTLQNEYSKVNQLQNNLLKTYIQQRQDLTDKTEQLISEARNQLDQQLTELQLQKGRLNMDKIARRDQAIREYQSLLSDINARNTSYLRDIEGRKSQLQNQLQGQAYKMQYNAMQKALSFWEEMASRGGLTQGGLRAAETAFGLPSGTLQAPTGIISGGGTKKKNKKEEEQTGVVDYTSDSFYTE